MRLSTRLALTMAGVSVLPLALLGVMAYRAAVGSHADSAFRNLELLAEHKRAGFEQWVEENVDAIVELASRPQTRTSVASMVEFRSRRIETDYLARSLRRDHLLQVIQNDHDLREVFVLDASDGAKIVGTDPAGDNFDHAGERYFRAGREGTWVEPPYFSLPKGLLQMTVAAPIRGYGGEVVAVVAAHLDLKEAGAIMTQGQRSSESLDAYIVNRHRIAVTPPRFPESSALQPVVHGPEIDRCIDSGSGRSDYTDYRGVPVLGAFLFLEPWGLCLVVKLDRGEALAEVSRFRDFVGFVMLFLLIAVASLAVLIASRVSRPLNTTIAALERIGAGDLGVRLAGPADGEIRRLFDGVNAMVDSLREVTASRDDLDSEVYKRERATIMLEQVRRQLSAVLSSLPGMAFRCLNNPDREMLYASLGTKNLLGFEPDDLVHNRVIAFVDLVHPADREAVRRAAGKAVDRRDVYDVEYRVRHADGSWRWVAERGQVVSEVGETPEVIEGFVLDTTERVRLQRELQQAQKMEVLGQVTGGVAHDFNNLLGIILGYVTLSLKALGDREPVASGHLQHVVTAAERARDIVAQMLSFSRGEAADKELLDIREQIGRSIALARSSLPASIEVVTHLDEQVPPVTLSAAQLDQILMNLCINARDAMDGNGTIVIRLFARRGIRLECDRNNGVLEGDFVELSVADSGPGVPPEFADRIFDPFFTSKAVGKGTGLGLSVVDGIVRGYGGCVLLGNRQAGQGLTGGAEFRLLFPAVEGNTRLAEEAEAGPEPVLDGSGRSVLVVDDEVDLAAFIGEYLESYGFEVVCLSDSSRALDEFAREPDRYHLLVTDQTMPGLSGTDLIAAVRQLRPGFPAIVCTGFSEAVSEQSARELGIGYLAKPIDPRRLDAELRARLPR